MLKLFFLIFVTFKNSMLLFLLILFYLGWNIAAEPMTVSSSIENMFTLVLYSTELYRILYTLDLKSSCNYALVYSVFVFQIYNSTFLMLFVFVINLDSFPCLILIFFADSNRFQGWGWPYPACLGGCLERNKWEYWWVS